MATSSIKHNIVIDNPEAANKFVQALERAVSNKGETASDRRRKELENSPCYHCVWSKDAGIKLVCMFPKCIGEVKRNAE